MPTNSIVLSVVIVATNEKPFLSQCLPALLKQETPEMEVLLVDNASTDGLQPYIKKNFPVIKYLRQTQRRGFAANNNIGIKKSLGKFVLLLNPDTVVKPKALHKLIKFMENNNSVGICGPQLRFPDGSLQLSCRKFPTLLSTISRRSPLRFLLKNSEANRQHLLSDLNHSLAQPVDWLLGACLCLRRSMLKEIGLLDEKYFLYVDDIDICWRAWKAGWQVWYVPAAVVTHHHQAVSDKKLLSKNSWYHLTSMFHFISKHILWKKAISV